MFRYPDKPAAQLARSGLAALNGCYVAQLKLDGWRCVIERTEEGLRFTSRHNKPIPIGPALAGELATMLKHLPERTLLDAEWLARRPSCRVEALWLFDVMRCGEVDLWSAPTTERFDVLRGIVPAELIVPDATGDYGAFFDSMQERPDAEGIVLKRRDARYIGSVRESADNPGWLKCKWRAGEDGMTPICGGRES